MIHGRGKSSTRPSWARAREWPCKSRSARWIPLGRLDCSRGARVRLQRRRTNNWWATGGRRLWATLVGVAVLAGRQRAIQMAPLGRPSELNVTERVATRRTVSRRRVEDESAKKRAQQVALPRLIKLADRWCHNRLPLVSSLATNRKKWWPPPPPSN